MKNLILVSGMPATGKSGFAQYLSHQKGWACVSKDGIKECLFDSLGFENRQQKVALGEAAWLIMCHVADGLLGAGLSVVLDNNFENGNEQQLDELIEAHDCRVVTVRFFAQAEALAQRFYQRDNSPSRHRGHVVNSCYPEKEGQPTQSLLEQGLSAQQFYERMRVRGMADFAVGDLIEVDSTDFSNVDYAQILSRIESLLSSE